MFLWPGRRRGPRETVKSGKMDSKQPMVAQPMVAQPMVAQPMVAQPMVAQPMVAQPMVAQPMVVQGQQMGVRHHSNHSSVRSSRPCRAHSHTPRPRLRPSIACEATKPSRALFPSRVAG
eukprot:COSAG02_NODE_9193_length_2294_cov_199.669704_2_plen_119_part_00